MSNLCINFNISFNIVGDVVALVIERGVSWGGDPFDEGFESLVLDSSLVSIVLVADGVFVMGPALLIVTLFTDVFVLGEGNDEVVGCGIFEETRISNQFLADILDTVCAAM